MKILWRRVGKDSRKSRCGRWSAHRVYKTKWSLYDNMLQTWADSATWTQVCKTASDRILQEEQPKSMKLHIIFGQRKCSYEGEYAPEALDIADEFTMDDNPDFLANKLEEHRKDKSFEAVEILIVNVPGGVVEDLLKPKHVEVNATSVRKLN